MKRFFLLSLGCFSMAVLLLVIGRASDASPVREAVPLRSAQGATPTPTDCPLTYTYTVSAGSIVTSTNLVPGSNCTSCIVPITLPFPFTFYGQTYTSANLSTQGNLQFVTAGTLYQSCPPPYAQLGPAILPYWNSDIDTGWSDPCYGNYGAPCGIFSTISGSAPNRTFKIEWRARFGGSNHETVDFEIRLHENSNAFEFVYGFGIIFGDLTSIGVQDGSSRFTSYSCDVSSILYYKTISWTPQYPPPCAPTQTATPVVTSTPTRPTATATRPSTPTNVTATHTPTAVTITGTPPSATPTPTITGTSTVCPVAFTDVPPGSTFYSYVRCLACRGIVSGYPDGTYRPNNSVTRGQAAKIISGAAGFSNPIPPDQQTFNDVPPGSTFWLYVERVAAHGAINGYPCGASGEPCPGVYFRPQNTLTRGQAAKVVAIAADYNDAIPPGRQTFSDVPTGSTFWLYVERVALHGVVNGYPDGTYRPQNNVTRGQLAKIAANAFFPGCEQ